VQAEPIGPVHIDKALLRQCCALGFDESQLIADLKARKTIRGTVAYYIILTSRTHFNKDDYLQGQLCESSQLQLQHPLGTMLASGDDVQGYVHWWMFCLFDHALNRSDNSGSIGFLQ
jgi:hypothetical protein